MRLGPGHPVPHPVDQLHLLTQLIESSRQRCQVASQVVTPALDLTHLLAHAVEGAEATLELRHPRTQIRDPLIDGLEVGLLELEAPRALPHILLQFGQRRSQLLVFFPDLPLSNTDLVRLLNDLGVEGTKRIDARIDLLHLFDLRPGFCSYYASTEVILLRSLGIPARLAVGFAQGERQDDESEGDIYLVRQRDAHAWPEVYFPGLGWVEFEPTASQLPIQRRLGESQPATAAGSTLPPGGDIEGRLDDRLEGVEDAELDLSYEASPNTAKTAATYAVILALILLSVIWRRRRRHGLAPLPVLLEGGLRRLGLQPPSALRRWARRVALAPLERAYLELNHALVRLNAPPDLADTPAERVAALAHLLPAAMDPAQRLLAEYHATTYSPRPGSFHAARQAARTIRDLSWRARIRRLVTRR